MKADFQKLEKELKNLAPRKPSELLRERIVRDMAVASAEPSHRRVISWTGWVAAAAAALALAVGAGLVWQGTPSTETAQAVEEQVPAKTVSADRYELVDSQRDLVGARDEGVMMIEGYGPVRAYRYQSLNHAEWKNPRNGRRLAVTQPAEEVVLVRMAMN